MFCFVFCFLSLRVIFISISYEIEISKEKSKLKMFDFFFAFFLVAYKPIPYRNGLRQFAWQPLQRQQGCCERTSTKLLLAWSYAWRSALCAPQSHVWWSFASARVQRHRNRDRPSRRLQKRRVSVHPFSCSLHSAEPTSVSSRFCSISSAARARRRLLHHVVLVGRM